MISPKARSLLCQKDDSVSYPRSRFVAWRWLMLSCLEPMDHNSQSERWTSPGKVGPKAAQLLWAIRMVVLKDLSMDESVSIINNEPHIPNDQLMLTSLVHVKTHLDARLTRLIT